MTPELRRVRSATRVQATFRKHSARQCFERGRRAAIIMQSKLRGWRARRRIHRWQSAIRAALAAGRMGELAVEIAAARASARSVGSPNLRSRDSPTLGDRQTLNRLERMKALRRDAPFSTSQKLPLVLRERARAEDNHSPSHFDVIVSSDQTIHDTLYESGKRHFAAGQFERALVDFHLVQHHLEKLERRHAKLAGRSPRFDPEDTGFRNLDDYVDKCNTGIQRRRRRALASNDGGAGGHLGAMLQAHLARLQDSCMHCLQQARPPPAQGHDRARHLSPRPA